MKPTPIYMVGFGWIVGQITNHTARPCTDEETIARVCHAWNKNEKLKVVITKLAAVGPCTVKEHTQEDVKQLLALICEACAIIQEEPNDTKKNS